MIRKGKDGVNISFQHYEEDGFVFESFASWCYTNRRWEYCKGTGKKVIGMTKIDIISGFLGAGKTTLIRDLIRQISDGNAHVKGCTVGVVDERSEIGGCYLGVAQNHLGSRTDILDCCPKAEGMIMLIRSMSPRVLAVDEDPREDRKSVV